MIARPVCAKMHNMDPEQAAARRFIREILRVTGWAPSRLARESGVYHTTLTRFLNTDVEHTLSSRTVGKIRKAAAKKIPAGQLDALWLLSRRTPSEGAADLEIGAGTGG